MVFGKDTSPITKTTFRLGQTRAHYPKGRPNPKLSEVRKKMFKEGKLTSSFQTDKNPSKLGIPNNGQFKKGHKPWSYIDGRSKNFGPLRYGDDWDKVRYLVYQRDHFTCQKCGKNKIRLDIHHIVPFLVNRNNSLSNLITLCRNCHMKIERQLTKAHFKGT